MHQVRDLVARKAHAEKPRCDIRRKMRLVHDDQARAGQHFPESALLDGHVGEQQVVVDHDHIRRLRFAPGLEHETILVNGAIHPEAILRGGRHLGPQLVTVRQHVGRRQIAAARQPRPTAEAP